jgi:drug/metabolite transporter (DMT)-like permease
MNRNSLIAISLGLLACFIWGASFVVARGVYEWVAPFTLAFWRWVVAFFALLPITYRLFIKQWPLVKAQWKYITVMGVVGVGTFNCLIYFAAHYTTSHHISLISTISPIVTLLLAGIIGFDKFTVPKVIGAISAFVGVIVIICNGDVSSIANIQWNKGDIILVVASIIWAIWSAALHYKSKELSSKVFLLAQVVVGICAILPFYIWENINVMPTPFTAKAWAVYLYVGIGASAVAWLAWQEATRRIGAVKTSLVYYTIPIFSSIMGVMFLHEDLEVYHFIGFAFIFSGIVIPNMEKIRREL